MFCLVLLFFNYSIYSQTSLNFNGSSSYVDLGSGIMVSSYTKEAWIKWDGKSGKNNIISGDISVGYEHSFWFPMEYGYRVSAGNSSGFNTVQDPNAVELNVWTHFAVTFDAISLEMVLYRNGIQVDSAVEIGGSGFNDDIFLLGAFNHEFFFGGLMDNARIWSDVRTPSEIADNYDKCLTGTESNLVALYKFEDGSGSSVLSDSTSNGNDGSLINMDINDDWVSGLNLEASITITSDQGSPTGANPIPINVAFDKPVTGFDVSDLVIGNGVASNFEGTGSNYSFDITPMQTGNVTVDIYENVVDVNTCGNGNIMADQFNIVYDMTLGTDINFIFNKLKLYPNPTLGELEIVQNDYSRIESLELYDIRGKKIYSKLIQDMSNNKIDISDLESGLYIIRIKSVEGMTTTRRIIKH